MLFLKRDPPSHLAHIVRQFWIVENPDPVPQQQKIVPDGYSEIIFHYGEPYRIKLYDDWEIQERMLFSGQVRKSFYLENTGTSGMLGIKLIPAAAYALFNTEMSEITDKVVPLRAITDRLPSPAILERGLTAEARMTSAQEWIYGFVREMNFNKIERISAITAQIIERKGMIDIEALANDHNISRRHLEREFKKIIGLSPKYFSRIIQFSYIFEALQEKDNSWIDVALNSGYFDQSHFIKNFKAFTGESPSQYGFDERNMANFFLKNEA